MALAQQPRCLPWDGTLPLWRIINQQSLGTRCAKPGRKTIPTAQATLQLMRDLLSAGVKGVPDKPPPHAAPASPIEHQRGLPAHRLAGNASSATLEVSARGMSSWESEGYTGGCSTQAFPGNPSRLGESTLQDGESYIRQRLWVTKPRRALESNILEHAGDDPRCLVSQPNTSK